MVKHEPFALQRRTLLGGLAVLGASAAFGGSEAMATVEQNTLKRRGVGLRAMSSTAASTAPISTPFFAGHFGGRLRARYGHDIGAGEKVNTDAVLGAFRY